ncbi:hypothetical protein U1Q18_032997 [Sarracenia purpurea var. burkii]
MLCFAMGALFSCGLEWSMIAKFRNKVSVIQPSTTNLLRIQPSMTTDTGKTHVDNDGGKNPKGNHRNSSITPLPTVEVVIPSAWSIARSAGRRVNLKAS